MVAPVLGDHPGLLDLAIVRILCPPPSLNKAGLSGSKFAHHPCKGWVAIPIISIKTSDCNYCIAIAMKQSLQNIFKVSQCSEQTIWPFDVQKRIQIFCCCTSITTIHNQFFFGFRVGLCDPQLWKQMGIQNPPRIGSISRMKCSTTSLSPAGAKISHRPWHVTSLDRKT